MPPIGFSDRSYPIASSQFDFSSWLADVRMIWPVPIKSEPIPRCAAYPNKRPESRFCWKFGTFHTVLIKFIFWGSQLIRPASRSFVGFSKHVYSLDLSFTVTKTSWSTLHGLKANPLKMTWDHYFIFRVNCIFVSVTRTHFIVWSSTQILPLHRRAWRVWLWF